MNIVTKPMIKFLDPVQDPVYCEEQLKKLYSAYRICYSAKDDLDPYTDKSLEEVSLMGYAKFIKSHMNHQSPLEHVQITVLITDFSRIQSQQVTRHRIASFSQKSQRYVNHKNFTMVNAPNFEVDGENRHLKFGQAAMDMYNELIDAGFKPEDCRGILPGDCATSFVMSMNLRSWMHFFNERCCMKAQWSVRYIATVIWKQFQKSFPLIFDADVAGPKCNLYGYCPEGKRTCGMKPTKEEVFHGYNEWKKLQRTQEAA